MSGAGGVPFKLKELTLHSPQPKLLPFRIRMLSCIEIGFRRTIRVAMFVVELLGGEIIFGLILYASYTMLPRGGNEISTA
jgi:hypothetical protein